MPVLSVTARGQVTLRQEFLRHIGVRPGDKVEVEALPDGRLSLKAARPRGEISTFVAMLEGRSAKRASLDEIDAAIADGWSGER